MSNEELLKLAVDITTSKVDSSAVPATKETGASTAAFLEEVYYGLVLIHKNLNERPIK